MGFPLIPFAAGMALGALATYGSRDKTVQKEVKSAAERLSSGAAWLYGSAMSGVSGLFGLGTDKKTTAKSKLARAEEAAEEEPSAKATPAKRTRAKPSATAGKKRTTRRTRETTTKAVGA